MENDDIEGYEDGEENLTFYYNRNERISHAPQLVKDYYSGKMNVKRGLLRMLISTKANRLLLFSIGVCMAALFFVKGFARNSYQNSINGTNLELSAFSFDDKIYVSNRIAENENLASPQDVTAQISVYDSAKTLIDTKTVTEKYMGKELFLRTTFQDYDILFIESTINIYGETRKMSTKIQKH